MVWISPSGPFNRDILGFTTRVGFRRRSRETLASLATSATTPRVLVGPDREFVPEPAEDSGCFRQRVRRRLRRDAMNMGQRDASLHQDSGSGARLTSCASST